MSSSTGSSWGVTALNGTIQAQGYYLIAESGGANGGDIPAPEASGNSLMAAGSGKVALFNNTKAATTSVPSGAIDFVGYGTSANAFEGSKPTNTLTNTTSAQRRPYANVDPAPGKGNAWDSNDNLSDFYVGAVAAPRNTASPTEAPMAAVTSLQPKGNNIQFLKDGTTVKVTGKAEAAEAGSTVKVYETSAKGTALGSATADSNGAFEISFTTDKALASVFVAATQSGLDESAAIQIDPAAASTSLTQAKLSYSVTNGVGTLIGGTGAAAANAIINVYANDTATEKLNTQDITAGTSGDFTATINNAPNTVYVTQTTSSAKGIMLHSNPVSVSKADTTAITKIADVRASDTKRPAHQP